MQMSGGCLETHTCEDVSRDARKTARIELKSGHKVEAHSCIRHHICRSPSIYFKQTARRSELFKEALYVYHQLPIVCFLPKLNIQYKYTVRAHMKT